MLAELSGYPDTDLTDIWTPIQFDAAVSYFGTYVENKLHEYDYDKKPPKPKYNLKDLLSDLPAIRSLSAYEGGKGVGTSMSQIRRRKKNE